jgi:HAD superfamily hydrolase (TIGR01484 family)
MKLKLLSTDFDGTLFAEFEDPPIPRELQALIGDLQRQGTRWVINTGREMSSLMESLARARVEIEPDYLVLVEREIHVREASRYVGLEPWNTDCAKTHAGLFARVRSDMPRLVEWINARFHAHIYEDSYSPLCLVASDNPQMDVIHHYLEEYCRGIPHLNVVRNDVYARFCHETYNKGTALSELSRRLSMRPAEVLAVGDHLNDLPMLDTRYAERLAAPANAVAAVQAAVRRQRGYVSARCHGRGVADAIKYYVAGRSG